MNPVFDPFSAAAMDDPYVIYREMRENTPVYHDADNGFWALTRFDDCQAAARDWRTFRTEPGVDLDDWGKLLRVNGFLNLDPPRHDELRDVVRKHFAPTKIKALEHRVEMIATQLLTPIRDRGEGDLAQEFAWPFPVRISAALLGLPSEDDAHLNALLRTLFLRTPGEIALPAESFVAAAGLRDYFAQKACDPTAGAKADVLSTLVEALRTDAITMDELVDTCCVLFIGAIDTVASIILNSLVQLERHPDQRAWLAEDAARIPAAVEELLRYEPPVQYMARTTSREVAFHDQTIPARERVLLVFAAANRDERRFPAADRLDVGRAPQRSVAFGDGIKFCLGAPLARLETVVALRLILGWMPGYVVTDLHRTLVGPVRGIDRLYAVTPRPAQPDHTEGISS